MKNKATLFKDVKAVDGGSFTVDIILNILRISYFDDEGHFCGDMYLNRTELLDILRKLPTL